MLPDPNVLDDLLCHRAFTIHASHLDCENVVIEAWRDGAKAALDEVESWARANPPLSVLGIVSEVREAVDDD
jgi:hypothetical protein